MVTYDDLREARISQLNAAAQAWQQVSVRARGLEQRVGSEVEAPLRRSGWQGAAADEAFRRMSDLHDEFELVAVQTRNLAAVLRSAAQVFTQAQEDLQAALDAAVSLGLIIHGNGTVSALDLPWEARRTRRPSSITGSRSRTPTSTTTPSEPSSKRRTKLMPTTRTPCATLAQTR